MALTDHTLKIGWDLEEAEATTDWIDERNAALGQTNEFETPRGAQPDPEGFKFEPQSDEPSAMMDDFYAKYVMGVKQK